MSLSDLKLLKMGTPATTHPRRERHNETRTEVAECDITSLVVCAACRRWCRGTAALHFKNITTTTFRGPPAMPYRIHLTITVGCIAHLGPFSLCEYCPVHYHAALGRGSLASSLFVSVTQPHLHEKPVPTPDHGQHVYRSQTGVDISVSAGMEHAIPAFRNGKAPSGCQSTTSLSCFHIVT